MNFKPSLSEEQIKKILIAYPNLSEEKMAYLDRFLLKIAAPFNEEVTNPMILKFGKYQGQDISQVPEDYLQWSIKSSKDTITMFEAELERRQNVQTASEGEVGAIVRAGFKALAMKYHPDQGGDPRKFAALKAAEQQLLEIVKEVADAQRQQQAAGAGSGVDPFASPATK